jgi:hypothetical protein
VRLWNPGSASIGTDATAYSIDTQGSIATLECPQKPTTCTPPRAADPVYLNANWPGATVNEDWVTRIHLAAPDAKGSVERYAVTLVRKKPADDRNALCATSRFLPEWGLMAPVLALLVGALLISRSVGGEWTVAWQLLSFPALVFYLACVHDLQRTVRTLGKEGPRTRPWVAVVLHLIP